MIKLYKRRRHSILDDDITKTTYWKSQDRKYCEFCKCWLADNKVSISFHENGKRHKESLKKHLSDLSKRSAKEFKQNQKMEDDIKEMEKAAMKAYAKDIQNNADLTSQNINEIIELSGNSKTIAPAPTVEEKSEWKEMKNDKGRTYYWNSRTDVSTYDPPPNFISKAKQENKKPKPKKIKDKHKKQKIDGAINNMEAVKLEEFGPIPCGKPYGSWKPVVKEVVKEINLQLPKVEQKPLPPVLLEPEHTPIEFKESKVDYSLEGPSEFKKRKLNNPKRNMRQRLDDE
ncbi:unnamed protein product [Danaus chrysippus]|uniref:(African queen) hypothetical protein n=1 Tax=Danaus chrysippus TaxID=151541 RepID=A0A8J2R099_9NEOP|nr:unnamed protein product [Danaus chrysippus]